MNSADSADSADEGFAEAARRLTGRRVEQVRPVSGAVAEAGLDDGRSVMVKRGDAPDAIRAEAAGLRWLAGAGTVRVPSVLGQDPEWLVTGWVATGAPGLAAAVRFGRELAGLHRAGAPAFGAAPPGGPSEAYIGRAPMRNSPAAHWPEWYAAERVLPYLRGAVDQGTLSGAEGREVERVCARLPELAGPVEPPARLHGDLWNGNVLWGADGRVRVVDPAAHGGHRETDLAMLDLFGCPHLDAVLDGYQEVAPLADGWSGRVALHQLFPLLVHVVLFGRAYAGRTVSAVRACLRA
ncbi:fructosamine kinase family protein [Streptomyces sp. NPDC048290]|uniref:fructosamine kinase family protein n=1 Tax=Streptomyces sp. NPDC048290 TaxID=3155811 RepID=UPI0034299677